MNKVATKIEGDSIDAFRVSLLLIDDIYYLFVKDESSKSDYIRLTYGNADTLNQKSRSVQMFRDIICEPKSDNGTLLGRFTKDQLKNKRLWIVFETVQRQKGKKGLALERFAGVSPPQSKWKKSIGSYTNFELQKISLKDYEDAIINKYIPKSSTV